MRRFVIALVALVGVSVLFAAVAGLVTGSATAAGTKKLVEGTLYDTTCAAACVPECPPPPHCGPLPQAPQDRIVCAQRAGRLIACPLEKRTIECVQAPCPGSAYPVYSGEGAIVKVRRRGTDKVLAAVPVVEGHFKIRLAAGQYVLHPYLAEEPCWSGEPWMVSVMPSYQGPIPVSLRVSDSCVAHPDAPQ